MFDIETDVDDLLMSQAAEIETKYQQNRVQDSNDYEYALKLSQQLNSYQPSLKNSAVASGHHNCDNYLETLADEFNSDFDIDGSNIDSDYLLALKLSQIGDSPTRSVHEVKDNFSLPVKLSHTDVASGHNSNNNYLETLADEFNSDFDIDGSNIDSDYLLALKLSQIGDSPTRSVHEVKDNFSLPVKLSHTDVASGHNSNNNYLETIADEFNSDFGIINTKNADSDYMLALKLSQVGDSPTRSTHKVDDSSLAVQFSQTVGSATKRVHNVDADYLLAVELSQAYDSPMKSVHKKSADKPQNVNMYLDKTTSVVDCSWETIDPNPDIHALFIAFNQRFFWGRLDMVEVKWSTRMTLCAGICSYQQRAGHCTVKLSKPLLKYRPRKDLVETLLHEMIHAYLFVTKNNRDRDGHGPQFHSHMYRINKESGASITVYHSFHDEVKLYQTHWWKCDGPCQFRSPFFGFVKRSRNRAPGPYDNWWNDHRATCGGIFQKIKEPADYGKKKSAANKNTDSKVTDKVETASIHDYFNRQKFKSRTESSLSTTKNAENMASSSSSLTNSNVKTSPPTLQNKKIFTLSDLSKNMNKRSPSKSPKKWVPLPRQGNILQFVNKS